MNKEGIYLLFLTVYIISNRLKIFSMVKNLVSLSNELAVLILKGNAFKILPPLVFSEYI